MSSNYAKYGNPNNNYKLAPEQVATSNAESAFSAGGKSSDEQFHPYKALQAAINKELMK